MNYTVETRRLSKTKKKKLSAEKSNNLLPKIIYRNILSQ